MSTLAMHETTLSDAAQAADASVALMDEESFRAFYDRTSRGVWAYLSRVTGDRQLADDLLQETYYRFYRAGAVHETESHRRNSLFCIATNLARDAHRRGHDKHHVELPASLAAQDNVASRAEGKTDLAKAMAQLKPVQREMLWLAYAQGSSHNEIAETLGVKASSVKILLFRARKKLADLLRGDRRKS
jgi:RNA polymerase sigma-70 factor, ECF subfamily